MKRSKAVILEKERGGRKGTAEKRKRGGGRGRIMAKGINSE